MKEKFQVDERLTLQHFRAFTFGLAAALFLGAIAELILSGHFKSPAQVAAFALCGIGLLALGMLWRAPGPRTVGFLRVAMAAIAVGSLVGVWFHFLGNFEFARETQAQADTLHLFVAAITGRDPLLAPGMLAAAAAAAVATTHTVFKVPPVRP